jgi:hypothetical protein
MRWKPIIIAFFISNLIANAAFAATSSTLPLKRLPCSSFKLPLPYVEFGFKTPDAASGFSCTVLTAKDQNSSVGVRWKKKDLRIDFDAGTYSFYGAPSNTFGFHYKGTPQNREVRMMFEGFFSDPEFIKKYKEGKDWTEGLLPLPKAVLFSPNNERAVIYQNQGMINLYGENQTSQVAEVVLKKDPKKFLSIHCLGCTVDEFFSWLINPLIQK